MRARFRLLLHLALLCAGLALVAWPILAGASPVVDCRGVPMHHGDVCHKAELDGTPSARTQTYDERLDAWRRSRPVLIGMGVAVAALAGTLLVNGRRPGLCR